MGKRLDLMNEVFIERTRQDEKWGGARHDDRHTPQGWAAFIHERVVKATFALEFGPDEDEYRHRMVQVAALAIAAIESLDRKGHT